MSAKEFSYRFYKLKSDQAKGMINDLTGQVTEAQKPNEKKKWGNHFLPSLARAHLYQQCNNFKDPGVQFYGGSEFSKIRDETDDIFLRLPPPKPTPGYYTQPVNSSTSKSDPHVDMSRYLDAYGGCFHGLSTVELEDGTLKVVEKVRRGDIIKTVDGFGRVLCVLQTIHKRGVAKLVSLEGGLRLTPYHPVKLEGKWTFPIDVKESEIVECRSVYTFLMEGDIQSVLVNGTECITLAHGIQGDVVATHEFLGTDRVKRAMKRLAGWNEGIISLLPEDFLRDPETGRICGFRGEDPVESEGMIPLNTRNLPILSM